MTRQHFTAIAAELLRQRPESANSKLSYGAMTEWERGAFDEWATIVIGLAGTQAPFNPRFDCQRLMRAAGLDR